MPSSAKLTQTNSSEALGMIALGLFQIKRLGKHANGREILLELGKYAISLPF